MFEFLHAADIHLDSPLRGLERYEGAPVEEIRLATRRALENLVQLALDRKVAFVIIAGDLFDGDWKDYNTGLFFAKQMSRLREGDIQVFILKGNHDAANKMTRSIKMPDNVQVFAHAKPQTFHLEAYNLAIHGQSFSTAAVETNLAQNYPDAIAGCFNIGVLHTCATGREGHARYAPCSVSDLVAKGYNYWALGHVHKREELNTDPLIIFPGNIQGRHIKEAGPKGCTIISVDEKHRVTHTFEDLSVLRWEHCAIDIATAVNGNDIVSLVQTRLDELLQAYPNLPLAVRVELVGAGKADSILRSDTEHWTNQIRAVAIDSGRDKIWIEKVKVNTTPDQTTSDAGLLDGPIGELINVINEFRDDSEQSKLLWAELADLEKKLSPEVKDAMGWKDDSFLSDSLHDVQDTLLERLSKKEPR